MGKAKRGEGDADRLSQDDMLNASGGLDFPLVGNNEISLPCIEAERFINTLDQLQAKLHMVLQLPLVWGGVEASEVPMPLLHAAEDYLQLRDQFRLHAERLRASVPPPSSKDSQEAFDVTEDGAKEEEGEEEVEQAPSNGLLGTPGADEACVARLAETIDRLAAATWQLVRQWRHHADDADLNSKLGDGYTAPAAQFLDHMFVLRRQMYLRHLTTPEQESSRTERLRDIWRRDNRNCVTLATLESRLANLLKERDTDRQLKSVIIEQLENQIESVENHAAEEIATCTAEREGDWIAEKASYNNERDRLERIYKSNMDSLTKLRAADRLAETALKKRKYKIESELENWLQKYDSEMTEKLDILETMTAEFEAETAEREEYEAKLDKIRDRYEAIVLKRERDEQQRIAEEALAIKREAAALYIQAFWRGFVVRRKLKSKGKKGKKGKKGGKKGGGKKGGGKKKGKKK